MENSDRGRYWIELEVSLGPNTLKVKGESFPVSALFHTWLDFQSPTGAAQVKQVIQEVNQKAEDITTQAANLETAAATLDTLGKEGT